MKKVIAHILFLLVYVGLLIGFNRIQDFTRPADYPEGIEYARATVVEVVESDMGTDPDYDYIRIGRQTLKMEIISGKYRGKTIEVLNFVTRTTLTASLRPMSCPMSAVICSSFWWACFSPW